MAGPNGGGLVELTEDVSGSPLYNKDLAPTTLAQRTWNKWHLASLWIGMAVCIPTYNLAAGLLLEGMTWTQAIGAIFLGNFIVLIPMVLIGHAGTKYGIPLPVFLRASFGSSGTHVPSIMRALVACGWFGIQTWIGGSAIYTLAQLLWPDLAQSPALPAFIGINAGQLVCFLLFWLMNVYFVLMGTESIKWLETLSAPLLIGIGVALLVWGFTQGGGVSRVLAHSENFIRPGVTVERAADGLHVTIDGVRIDDQPRIAEFRHATSEEELAEAPWLPAQATTLADPGGDGLYVQVRGGEHESGPLAVPIRVPTDAPPVAGWVAFLATLTAMVGFWATLALNIPDFTRYAASQKDQVLGQAYGLPTTMTFYSFVGVAVTCAALVIFPDILLPAQAPWDPVALMGRFPNPAIVVLSMICLLVATLTTNIAANVVAPANAFSNLAPRAISFKMGGMITALIGVVMMPWKLISTTQGYIFTWLIGYSALLGPIAGIMIADYFVVRRQRLNLPALYRPTGVDVGTILILVAAIAPNVPGFLNAGFGVGVPELWTTLYKFAWFVGFFVAFLLYSVYGSWKRTATTSTAAG